MSSDGISTFGRHPGSNVDLEELETDSIKSRERIVQHNVQFPQEGELLLGSLVRGFAGVADGLLALGVAHDDGSIWSDVYTDLPGTTLVLERQGVVDVVFDSVEAWEDEFLMATAQHGIGLGVV